MANEMLLLKKRFKLDFTEILRKLLLYYSLIDKKIRAKALIF